MEVGLMCMTTPYWDVFWFRCSGTAVTAEVCRFRSAQQNSSKHHIIWFLFTVFSYFGYSSSELYGIPVHKVKVWLSYEKLETFRLINDSGFGCWWYVNRFIR